MSETNGVDVESARSPRRASPVSSVVMLLVAGLTWFFLHNLADLHVVLEIVITVVAGGAAGFVAQEIVAHRRRR